ncbi:MAG TPA: calcium/proton exchanger [Anaerolineae bacterium]|nr:calcium/proton exchanger [Anaerolineae bacterium]
MTFRARLKDLLGLSLPLIGLLVFIPISIALELAHADPLLRFITSAVGVVPLAGLIGEGTEALAAHTGPRLGGLLNATLGNAAELIIALAALREGLIDLVLASITGSILGNLLLVLGAALLIGGIKNGTQKFDRASAGLDATLLILSVIALGIPSLFNFAIEPNFASVEGLSIGASIAMLIMYALAILHSLTARTHEGDPIAREAHPVALWSPRRALIALVIAVGLIVVLSEILVGAVEPVTATLGLSEFFLGIILVPIVGNVAEHLVAVQVAVKNKMDLSLSIAIGSSLQIALFVAPVLVFLSLLVGHPLKLEFNNFELAAVAAASIIAAFVSLDGESNWLEGAMLLVVYAILALAFFFLPMVAEAA